jgi:Ca2+/H+ antiporter
MTTVSASRPGRLQLAFHVGAASALATAVIGGRSRVCDDD